MPVSTTEPIVAIKVLGMGQVAIAEAPAHLSAVLGSCVGIALYCERHKLGAFSHVVLPNTNGQPAMPGKFADTAVPHMLRLFENRGVRPSALVAKMAGGACMFGADGPLKIGESNAETILQLLDEARIKVLARDIGGTCGRRVTFDCRTGQLTVETVGNPPKTL